MLNLITAWKTPNRVGDPVVLYCGMDGVKARKIAIDPKNGKTFARIETAQVTDSYKLSRPRPDRTQPPKPYVPQPPSEAEVAEAAKKAPAVAAPAPAPAQESGDGGPEVKLDPAPKKKGK